MNSSHLFRLKSVACCVILLTLASCSSEGQSTETGFIPTLITTINEIIAGIGLGNHSESGDNTQKEDVAVENSQQNPNTDTVSNTNTLKNVLPVNPQPLPTQQIVQVQEQMNVNNAVLNSTSTEPAALTDLRKTFKDDKPLSDEDLAAIDNILNNQQSAAEKNVRATFSDDKPLSDTDIAALEAAAAQKGN